MSSKELDRLDVVRRVGERRLTQAKAAEILGLSPRQVRRLCVAVEADGASGLVSKKRGRPSNNQRDPELRTRALGLVRGIYGDFGPTLAAEKLVEKHGIRLSRETLRRWMVESGIWATKDQRVRQPHQPRQRRDCLGELIQIDGSPHDWFEGRAPECTLLVYVDDATGRLMELRFARSESAFDYFAATEAYVRRYGKPVAFYSDKHSIFRVPQEGTTGRTRGVTQFGRALSQLNIDIICANTPQAKGRVERMNQTLQDRLVKELRLAGIAGIEAGNEFLPKFMEDYNRRFARQARNSHDAHRVLHDREDLTQIFSWQEERRMSRNLVVHFKRVTYLVTPSPIATPLGGKTVQIRQWADGRVDIYCGEQNLAYAVFDKKPMIEQGEIVENKRLGAALAVISQQQDVRDQIRLASWKLTLREKDQIMAARADAGRSEIPLPPPGSATSSRGRRRVSHAHPISQTGVTASPTNAAQAEAFGAFLARFHEEQKARKKMQREQAALRRAEAAVSSASR